MEFKKRHLIIPSGFESAEKLNSAVSEAEVCRQAKDIVKLASNDKNQKNDYSFYKRHSCKLMKQAAAYATQHRTKYVALFNWEVLVLVCFQAMELCDANGNQYDLSELRRKGVGEWC